LLDLSGKKKGTKKGISGKAYYEGGRDRSLRWRETEWFPVRLHDKRKKGLGTIGGGKKKYYYH